MTKKATKKSTSSSKASQKQKADSDSEAEGAHPTAMQSSDRTLVEQDDAATTQDIAESGQDDAAATQESAEQLPRDLICERYKIANRFVDVTRGTPFDGNRPTSQHHLDKLTGIFVNTTPQTCTHSIIVTVHGENINKAKDGNCFDFDHICQVMIFVADCGIQTH